MDHRVKIPLLNPLNFVLRDRALETGYNFKHFDAWTSMEQMLPYEQGKCYAQKWQKDDIIVLQIKASLDPAEVRIRNSRGEVVSTFQFSVVDELNGDIYLQAQIDLSDLDEGFYRVEMLVGDPVLLIFDAEVIHVKEVHEGTLLFKYRNRFNNNILWEYLTEMMIRMDGVVKYDKTSSNRTGYTDQPGNAKTVKGTPYRKFKLYVGNKMGMPDWYADRLEEILDQNIVTIDGKGFAAASGSELTPNRIERYAWAQWTVDLLETNNSREKVFEVSGIQEENIVLSYTTTTKLFGPVTGDANDNTIQIEEIT